MNNDNVPVAVTDWRHFAAEVERHILNYTVPQYGDVNEGPVKDYTAEDCIRAVEKYCGRFGRSARIGEELRDLLKMAHYIQIAAVRLGLPGEDTGIPATDYAEQNFALAPVSLSKRRAEKARDGSEWSPRDALIDVLRNIDGGEKIDNIFIATHSVDETSHLDHISYTSSGASHMVVLGLIHSAALKYEEDSRR